MPLCGFPSMICYLLCIYRNEEVTFPRYLRTDAMYMEFAFYLVNLKEIWTCTFCFNIRDIFSVLNWSFYVYCNNCS